jgi:hypothetical protein
MKIPRRICKDYIKTDLKEIGCVCEMDSSGSGYGPMADFCGHCNERRCWCSGL